MDTMGQFLRAVLTCRNQIIPVALGLSFVVVALATLPVRAQSGCTGDPCVFDTPTPTVTRTPTPTPGPGTPTRVPMPTPSPFPRPHYGIPTPIPNISYPDVPGAISLPLPTPQEWQTPEALPMPSPIASPVLQGPPAPLTQTNPSTITLDTINTTLSISYSTPLSLNTPITSSSSYTFITGLNESGRGLITGLITYTDYLSGQIALLQYTDTLTLTTAPDWYAPYLPREMANVGWTFEQIGEGSTARYSLNTWAYLFGAMVAMPIRLARGLLELLRFLGPFGLFMIWLLVIMLPAVLGFKILLFIKNTIIRLINFALTVIDWILKLWNAIPFKSS